MKKIAIIQSNYIPWKGYFDIIHDVDLFVFYDDVQFTKNDWRNRNLIKTQNGPIWLTIPVGTDLKRLIRDVTISDTQWAKKHWKSIMQYYSKAPYFKEYRCFFEYVYLDCTWNNLSQLNQYLIISIARNFLGITTVFKDSYEFHAEGDKSDRLLDLLKKVDARTYVSGPSAGKYIDEAKFAESGIQLEYKSYSCYPEYPQLNSPFTHNVSIIDLLFNVGPDTPRYIWMWRDEKTSLSRKK